MRHSCSLTPGFQSTLPRGERLACVLINTGSYIFQSTLPRGERLEEKILSEELQKFQSTLPRGERRMNAGHGKRSIMHFNPRSHEGSDQTALIIARERWIFQSTLPRGERRLQIWVMKCSLRFQSTLPRGERRMCSHVE